jgi:hypothetical protein
MGILKFERAHRQGAVFLLDPHVSVMGMLVPEGECNALHPRCSSIGADASSAGDDDVLNSRA